MAKCELEWHDFTCVEDLPIDTLLLVEVKSNANKFQTAVVRHNGNGIPFGYVGMHFMFDCTVLKWAILDIEGANDAFRREDG